MSILDRVEMMPRLNRLTPALTTVEVIGLPRAGKSSALDFLMEKDRAYLSKGVSQVIVPEFSYRIPELAPGAPVVKNIHQKSFYLGQSILNSFIDGYKEAQSKQEGISTLYICERGPNDFLTSERWEDILHPGRVDPPADQADNDIDWNKYYFPSISKREKMRDIADGLCQFVDGVIFYRVSLSTAMRRRELQGLPREGRLVNPEAWGALEGGYRWWLDEHFPLIREKFGTGLLIIDGEEGLEANNIQIEQYLNKLVQQNILLKMTKRL